MGNRRDFLTKSIVSICQKLDAKGFVANHDGNISCKFEGMVLATPTAESKGDISPEMILTLDMKGKKISGCGKPFSEINLHLVAYEARNDINAVVHAHPPYAMSWGLTNSEFQICVPEAIVSIGDKIPITRHALPGSDDHKEIISEALAYSDVFMMTGNGVLSVGRDLKEAYLRLELLEHLIKISSYAQTLGPIKTLPENDKRILLDKRASLGLGPPKKILPPSVKEKSNLSEIVKDIISQEIKNLLQEEKS